MKVVGIVGSPRKNGNTELLTAHALSAIAQEGLDTELIRLAGLDIRPCNACMICKKEERCSIEDDLFPIYLKMKEADGIILASPVYYGSATALIKALIERCGYISRWNGEPFSGKVGGSTGGSTAGWSQLHHGSTHLLVSNPGADSARINLLECSFRQ